MKLKNKKRLQSARDTLHYVSNDISRLYLNKLIDNEIGTDIKVLVPRLELQLILDYVDLSRCLVEIVLNKDANIPLLRTAKKIQERLKNVKYD